MTPASFLAEVAHPNMAATMADPDDMRVIVNAILTLDALAGMIHAHGKADGTPGIAEHAGDETYREALATVSPSYRVLRDAAASLKHGELTHPRPKAMARLLRSPDALGSEPNTLGTFQCGDEIGGGIIVIRHDASPGFARASDVVCDSYRMLQRIVEGGPAETDPEAAATFLDGGAIGPA